MPIQPYLFFNGRADEAIAFYGQTLGAEIVMRMEYGQNPDGNAQCPDGSTPPADKVMHASLRVDDGEISLSDGMSSGEPDFRGFSLSLTCADDAQAKQRFEALAEGGKIMQPLIATFFSSSFGMVQDRLGVDWIVLVPAPQQG